MLRANVARAENKVPLKFASLEETCKLSENGTVLIPSIQELSSIMHKCRRESDISLAMQLHTYIPNHGLDSHRLLGNNLVCLLVDLGLMSDARHVFDRLLHQDDSSWNCLIKGCAKCGDGMYALYLYKKVLVHNTIQLSPSTFVALMKACAELRDLEAGSNVYADAVRKGLLEQDVFLGTAVVDMYAKCGFLAAAQEVFDSLSVKDVVSWTTLITGCVQEQNGEDALHYFEKMQQEGIPPDDITFACCLQACGIVGATEKGQVVHMDIVKKGLETDVYIGNVLIDMYSICGFILDAQDVFEKLPRDVVSWNTLLAGYVENGRYKEAVRRFWQMKQGGVCPEAVTLVCILKACGSLGDMEGGQKMHGEVIKQDLQGNAFIASALVDTYLRCGFLAKAQEVFDTLAVQDVVSWTALLTGYTDHGHCEATLSAYKKMQHDGISPVIATFVSVLKACMSLVALDKGWEAHAEVVLRGFEEDYVVGSTLLGMYARCACLNEAQHTFGKLPHADLVAWTTLISGYALVGDIESVSHTLNKMFGDGLQPGSVTCGHVLNACNHRGLTDEGWRFFDTIMMDLGIIPTSEQFTCMVDLFSRAGQMEMAATVIKHMPRHPSAVVWHVVLAACQKWNNVEVGTEAFEHAMLLDEDDYAAYVSISNIYADVFEEEDLHILEAQYW